MKIVGEYSFANGKAVVEGQFPALVAEVRSVIRGIDASKLKIKVSKEKTSKGRMLFSPPALNEQFKDGFKNLGWTNHKTDCEYSTQYYVDNFSPSSTTRGAYRDMDFVKDSLGVEVQFGKYAFMVYNVAAKMTIFRKLGIISAGVEIVPVKDFADEMSTGVSYFEQFCWDLDHRGTGDIDTPVLILGITGD